jgi:hypothetical protein
MHDDIAALLATKFPEYAPGSKEYFTKYPSCWTEVVEGLSTEKRVAFEEIAELWNSGVVDENIRARYDS